MDTIVIHLFLAITLVVNILPLGTLVRGVFGLPVLLFLPGYGVLLLLFPRRRREDDSEYVGLRYVERLALAFGISLTLAPLVALGYELLGVSLSRVHVVVGFTVVTATSLLAGEGRRRRLPARERYTVPLGRRIESIRLPRSKRYGSDNALNFVLVLSMVFAFGSLGYGLMAPTTGEKYTNFYLVTEGGEGELVAADYPLNLTDEVANEIVVGVDNHEGRDVMYHIIIQLQRVSDVDAGGISVLDREQVARTSLSVPENETGRTTIEFDPPAPDGEGQLRLVYLLYEGEVSSEPTIDTAYRSLYLWVESDDVGGGTERPLSSQWRPGLATGRWGE